MWIAYLIVAIVGLASLACIIVGAYISGCQKTKEGRTKDLAPALCIIGAVVLCVCIFVFWLTTRIDLMHQCLNQPITSEMQLYGYKILDKRHFREKVSFDSPEKGKYFISIFRILPPFWTFYDVEVSEEIYPKLIKGKSYLPENDPNTPALTPALQDQ